MAKSFENCSTIRAPEIRGYSDISIGSPQLLTAHHGHVYRPQETGLEVRDSQAPSTARVSDAVQPLQDIAVLPLDGVGLVGCRNTRDHRLVCRCSDCDSGGRIEELIRGFVLLR